MSTDHIGTTPKRSLADGIGGLVAFVELQPDYDESQFDGGHKYSEWLQGLEVITSRPRSIYNKTLIHAQAVALLESEKRHQKSMNQQLLRQVFAQGSTTSEELISWASDHQGSHVELDSPLASHDNPPPVRPNTPAPQEVETVLNAIGDEVQSTGEDVAIPQDESRS